MHDQRIRPGRLGGGKKKLAKQPTRDFAFRLCLALGYLHPDYMLSELTSRQLMEWQAWYLEHPFGDDLRDYMIAQLTSLTANINTTKNTDKSKPTDWLPLYREPEQKPDEMKRALRRLLHVRNNSQVNSGRTDR